MRRTPCRRAPGKARRSRWKTRWSLPAACGTRPTCPRRSARSKSSAGRASIGSFAKRSASLTARRRAPSPRGFAIACCRCSFASAPPPKPRRIPSASTGNSARHDAPCGIVPTTLWGLSTLVRAAAARQGSEMLEAFILRWGYAAVAVGTFLEGEVVLIAGGALAHRGLLSLPVVVLAAFVGSVTGDQLWFHVGRRAGRSFVTRRPRLREPARRAEARLARRGTAFVLGFRFLYGLRTVTPIILGATGYSTTRFLVLNVVSAAVWATIFGTLGFALGASLESLLRRAVRVEELLAAAVVVGLLLWMATRARRHRSGAGPSTLTPSSRPE
nr:MAG: hypothetical protein DIU78_15090 [Pseudomonadota bacterium]